MAAVNEDEPSAESNRSRPALARPYSWTEGRTQPEVELAIEARVQLTPEGRAMPPKLTSPQWTVIELCAEPRSVAELAAHMSLPLGVAKVLVADLLSAGLVFVQATLDDDTSVDERRELIERVLSGLRAR